MKLDEIRRKLGVYQPTRFGDGSMGRAAVAMILRPTESDTEVLFIQRAVRSGDPWSGHMAFPGGRSHPDDSDLIHTAMRETSEEVGIDLRAHGELIGTLDDLRAYTRNRPLDLVISPFVCALHTAVDPVHDVAEVQCTVWVPISFLCSPAARGVHRRSIEGVESEFPAYCYEDYTIWGITHRILERFFELVADEKEFTAH